MIEGKIKLKNQTKTQKIADAENSISTKQTIESNNQSICENKQELFDEIQKTVGNKPKILKNIQIGIDNFCSKYEPTPPSDLEILTGKIKTNGKNNNQNVIIYNPGSGNISFEDICLINNSISHCG
jgi:hypothetical protein